MPPESDDAQPPAPPEQALPALIEALLFVSDGPVEPASLARALNVPRRRVERAFEPLARSLRERGMRLQLGPDGAQLVTAPEAAPYVEYFLGLEATRRLTNASLETLAIVAYRQPVTRATIESIRGVNSDAAIATLRARGLVDASGRAPGPGRPTLFVTTQRFLEHFGLGRPDELPALDELRAATPDAPEPLPELEAEHRPEEQASAAEASPPPARGVARRRNGTGSSFLPAGEESRAAAELPSRRVTLPRSPRATSFGAEGGPSVLRF